MELSFLKSILQRENLLLTLRFVSMLMIISLLIVASFTKSMATPGDLDPTFGSGGKVITSVGDFNDIGSSMALQSDGKIIVVGFSSNGSNNDFAIVRYNLDGTLDTTFGVGGKVITPIGNFRDEAKSVAIQPDGKIVVAGFTRSSEENTDFVVVRYNSNGSLDTSFDGDGKVITSISQFGDIAYSTKIQVDGKIVAVGTSFNSTSEEENFVVVRYNSNGSLDTTFDGDGVVLTDVGSFVETAFSLAIQSDGKLVVAGATGVETTLVPVIVRYNSNGSLDMTFGGNGIVTTPVPNTAGGGLAAIAIQPDGKIIGAGAVISSIGNNDFLVARYNTNGSLDSSFDNDGIVVTTITGESDGASSIAIQQNGKIVVGGSREGVNHGFAAARYNPNGSLDTGFGNGGTVITPVGTTIETASSVAIQTDGKIILAGRSRDDSIPRNYFAVVRYQGDSTTSVNPLFDFDGDRKTDISVYRSGTWWLNQSQAGLAIIQFGLASDLIAPADFDGDGKTDIAVFRPTDGLWYVLRSSNGSFFAAQFGQNGDLPRPADFDGDGKADITVFRPSNGTWYRLNSSNNQVVIVQFGTNGDAPLMADFDGDRKSDIAVWRPSDGIWYWLNSSNGEFRAIQFGLNGDIPATGDFDGDGKTDVNLFRRSNGVWYRLNSSTGGFVAVQFGLSEDVPVVGDYDGDGKSDVSVWRPSSGVWYRINSSNGEVNIEQFGMNGDKAIPSAFLP